MYFRESILYRIVFIVYWGKNMYWIKIKACNEQFLYRVLTDELLLAGALNVEKKSNPLVGGATGVSACFGRFFGVFTVISSLKMLGLCTKRKEVSSSSASDNTPVKILERLSCLQAPLIQLNPGLNNALAINKLREYFCLQRENPISKRATLIVVCLHVYMV